MTTRPLRHSMVLTGMRPSEGAYSNRARRDTLDPAPGAPLSSAPTVSDFSQSYSVEIAGSLEDCFAVLTDFDAYPSWSGPVTECRVLERHPDGLPKRVAFSLDMMLKIVHYTLDYEYEPPRGGRPLHARRSRADAPRAPPRHDAPEHARSRGPYRRGRRLGARPEHRPLDPPAADDRPRPLGRAGPHERSLRELGLGHQQRHHRRLLPRRRPRHRDRLPRAGGGRARRRARDRLPQDAYHGRRRAPARDPEPPDRGRGVDRTGAVAGRRLRATPVRSSGPGGRRSSRGGDRRPNARVPRSR